MLCPGAEPTKCSLYVCNNFASQKQPIAVIYRPGKHKSFIISSSNLVQIVQIKRRFLWLGYAVLRQVWIVLDLSGIHSFNFFPSNAVLLFVNTEALKLSADTGLPKMANISSSCEQKFIPPSNWFDVPDYNSPWRQLKIDTANGFW